ncbi:unnamed protein product [Euphydryas editha]|uniref:THAP-type domain-containing protein n=1 Tax=Euphydryas editha TaxID=104508 RepID=A0AAU9V3R5_EUPED|nr:unnamed protein product [Euphydryas editha]
MPRRCELGCEPSDVPLHVFPNPAKYPERFRAWVTIVGGKLETPHDYENYRKRKLCDIHFTNKDRNRNNRLNALAVPSVHLPSWIPAITQQETNISSVSESLSTGPSTSFTVHATCYEAEAAMMEHDSCITYEKPSVKRKYDKSITYLTQKE